MTEIDTSELDRLSAVSEQYNVLMEFLEEFLGGEQIRLYQHATGLTDVRVCTGGRRLTDYCPHRDDRSKDCLVCDNTGFVEFAIEDCDLPFSGNKQDLVYKFLDIDPQKVEKQRRAILASL